MIVLFFSCQKDWKGHYDTKSVTVNSNVWDAIQKDENLSVFVQYVKKYQYDTLFLTDHTYTLFIPNNKAFAQFKDSAETTKALLNYNICEFFVQAENIDGIRKIQTLSEKFALFNRTNEGASLDGVPLNFESPLYLNGKYFIMDVIAYPKYNLYEYFTANNFLLKKYIDSKDSIILDKSKSRPLGFDENGHTIYDTVAIKYNLFEAEYFPVSKESRYKTATFVFPKEEDYNIGLNRMAQALGGSFKDYHDIPLDWQNKILIPYLLNHGVFENLIEPDEFLLAPGKDTLKLKNILGDSVAIDYAIGEKAICSNGYAYNYSNFKVPDTLWATTVRFEAEHLLRNTGIGSWAWKEGVSVSGSESFAPKQSYFQGVASKDSSLLVEFYKNYQGSYSLQFNIDNLWPRKYLMVVRTSYNYGGKYKVYVNDVLVKTIDYIKDNIITSGDIAYASVISPKRYYISKKGAYISFDCWVNNLTEYGKAKIKFEYVGPSTTLYQALLIDYIDFKPY
jgi:hypothetical protein